MLTRKGYAGCDGSSLCAAAMPFALCAVEERVLGHTASRYLSTELVGNLQDPPESIDEAEGADRVQQVAWYLSTHGL